MRNTFLILVNTLVISFSSIAQVVLGTEPKRFIDRFEIFAGLNFSMNYGNKFVDDYESNIFRNKKELKSGYCFGFGLFHPVKSRIGVVSINAKLLFEQKGTKSKFTTAPLDTSATNNLVQTVQSDYSYNYITLAVVPSLYFGKNKKWFVSLGGYYSWLQTVDAHVLWGSKSNSYNEVSEQFFNGRNIFGIDPKGGITSFSQPQQLTSFQVNDYGVIVGIGYVIPFNDQHGIAVQITDHVGMLDTSKQIFGAPLETPSERNHSINFIISYIFNRPIKKNNN